MTPAITEQRRRELKQQWSEFIEQLLIQTGWTMQDLSLRVGCSIGCVSRWKSNDLRIGTIPTRAAARVLHELAERNGLI